MESGQGGWEEPWDERIILRTHKSHPCTGQPDIKLSPCHVTTALAKVWGPGQDPFNFLFLRNSLRGSRIPNSLALDHNPS